MNMKINRFAFVFLILASVFLILFFFNDSSLNFSPNSSSGSSGNQVCEESNSNLVYTHTSNSGTNSNYVAYTSKCEGDFTSAEAVIGKKVYALYYDKLQPRCNTTTNEVYWVEVCGDNQICTDLSTGTKKSYNASCVPISCGITGTVGENASLSVSILGTNVNIASTTSQVCGSTSTVGGTTQSHADAVCANNSRTTYGVNRTFSIPSTRNVLCDRSTELCVPFYATKTSAEIAADPALATKAVPGYCVPRAPRV